MARSHQITCAHNDCGEWSITAALQTDNPEQVAAEHRAQLTADGWTDHEGRDYCPQHTPAGAVR
jgi:hypothetical protein